MTIIERGLEATSKPPLRLRSGNGYAILMSCMDAAEKYGWSLKDWRAFSRKFRGGTWEDAFSLVCERFDVQLLPAFSPEPHNWTSDETPPPPLELSEG